MDIRDAAKACIDKGLAVCKLRPGEKRPGYHQWNLASLMPSDFCPTDNIGIQGGRLSGDLWTVDLDSPIALHFADDYLPDTGLVEGRDGKPRSHRMFRVFNIPPDLAARPDVAGGIGGPRNRQFTGPDKVRHIDLIGTGLQTAAPPSLWTSKDGNHHERRRWDAFGEPRIIDASELFGCVCRLALACGCIEKVKPPARTRTGQSSPTPSRLPLPTGEAARQARAFLAAVQPAVEGKGGNTATFAAAAVLVVDFGLTQEEALPILCEWNANCRPPWSVEQLVAKLQSAAALEGERGWRVRTTNRVVSVNIRPGDREVLVGLGTAAEGRSYVDLSPNLHAGMVKVGPRRVLAPELEAVAWEGVRAVLVPASTVATNKRECWEEFYLARLLRSKGADVVSLHLPPGGRRRTLADADPAKCVLVEPPRDAAQATQRAEQAGGLARELDAERKSMPRAKPSPKLDAAMEFVRKYRVTSLTQDVVRKARKKGISKDTLRRALGRGEHIHNPSSSPLIRERQSKCHRPVVFNPAPEKDMRQLRRSRRTSGWSDTSNEQH
jgi:hypothetical protein